MCHPSRNGSSYYHSTNEKRLLFPWGFSNSEAVELVTYFALMNSSKLSPNSKFTDRKYVQSADHFGLINNHIIQCFQS